MTLQYIDVHDVSRESENNFFRCKRLPDNELKECINTIYKLLNAPEPNIRIYENPREINDSVDEKTLITHEKIGIKIRDAWVENLIFNEGTWEYFRDHKINEKNPEVTRKKIGSIYEKIITKHSILTKEKSMYNDNALFFANFVRDFVGKDEFSNTLLDFLNGGVIWFKFSPNTAYVLRTPLQIVLSNQGELHSDNPLRPAVQWATGEPECFLWNVWFDYKLWYKVTNHEVDAKWCVNPKNIENIEQRAKALRVVGYKSIMKSEYKIHSDKKTVYSWRNNRWESKELTYELYGVPHLFDDIRNGRDVIFKFTYYHCPSTDREFFSSVDPKYNNVMDAMGSKFKMSGERFKRMQLES